MSSNTSSPPAGSVAIPDPKGYSTALNHDRPDGGSEGDWIQMLPDSYFGHFGGAICLNIHRTYDSQGDLASVSDEKSYYSSEEDLEQNGLGIVCECNTRIMICYPLQDDPQSHHPVSMSRGLFKQIAQRYGCSSVLSKIKHASICRQSMKASEQFAFKLMSTRGILSGMAIAYDSVQKSTFVLVICTSDREAETFINSSRIGIEHWTTVPLVALDLAAKGLPTTLEVTSKRVRDLGSDLKMHDWDLKPEQFDIKNLDLTNATRKLNFLLIDLAYADEICQISQSQLNDMERMVESDLSKPGFETGRMQVVETSVRQEIQRLKSAYDGFQAWNGFLTRRAEAYRGTVFSLIAQRDSAINLEIAQQSSNIAEQSMAIAQLSRQDNIAMKEVAIAAVKDSAAMRVIAAVTLFFLPPTFVATFFSTSFLDFKPTEPGDHVSNWIWVYFVLTVVLIVTVMGYWQWSTRHALKAIPQLQRHQAEKSKDGSTSA